MASIDALVVDAARANHDLIRREQLRTLGVTSRMQERLVRAGLIRPVTHAVFALGRAPLDWSGRLRAAVAEAGPSSGGSHAAAAVVWECPRIAPGAIEVTVPRSQSVPRRTIGRVHRRRIEPCDFTVVDGIAVTLPGRTLFDMAARLGPVVLDLFLQDLARRGLVTADQLASDLARWRGSGVPGVARFEALLRLAAWLPDAESWLEAIFLRLLHDHGFSMPETQVEIVVDAIRYRVDLLWRARKLIVELDGHETHATRAARAADAERDARLGTLGYETLRFAHEQVVGRPRFVLAQVGQRIGTPTSLRSISKGLILPPAA